MSENIENTEGSVESDKNWKAIREENKDVLFGFVTARNNSKLRKNAQVYGAHFLLSKPFTPEMLNTTIQSIIS